MESKATHRIVGVTESGRPEISHLREKEIRISGGPWPAGTFVDFVLRILHEEIFLIQELIQRPFRITLDVRIHDRHQMTTLPSQSRLECFRFREHGFVPGEVAFPVRVFDVQPQSIVRDIEPIVVTVHTQAFFLCLVIPTTLMMGDAPLRWKLLESCQSSITLPDSIGGRPRDQECIQDTGFAHPLCLDTFVVVVVVDSSIH